MFKGGDNTIFIAKGMKMENENILYFISTKCISGRE